MIMKTPKEKLLKETESLRNNIVNSNDIKVSDFLKFIEIINYFKL